MDRYSHRREKFGGSNPSFSSSLLDSIYRSIDESDEELMIYKETMKMEKQQINGDFKDEDQEIAKFQRICMIEKWMMEKKESQKVIIRRRSSADFSTKARDNQYRGDYFFSNSSSSCSDNSSINGFSSSEAELYVATRNRVYSDDSTVTGVSLKSRLQKPKPIRTNGDDFQNPKHEKGFAKTKSKALKIYSDLKKAKQPISPGGKLATFLNSIFTTGNSKKPKIFEANSDRKSKSANTSSTCSSASSFSRSCLSKTPSKLNNNNMIKRSVRFVDDDDQDYQPCMEASKEIINRRVEEAARDLLRNYQKRVELEYDLKSKIHVKNEVFDNYDDEEYEYEDEDDLFELDNLSAIGNMERYREELPVYETTHLHTNRAIANGLIL